MAANASGSDSGLIAIGVIAIDNLWVMIYISHMSHTVSWRFALLWFKTL